MKLPQFKYMSLVTPMEVIMDSNHQENRIDILFEKIVIIWSRFEGVIFSDIRMARVFGKHQRIGIQ